MYFDTLTFCAHLMFSSLHVMLTFTFSSFSDAHRLATFSRGHPDVALSMD